MITVPPKTLASADAPQAFSFDSRRRVKIGRPTPAESERLNQTILGVATVVFLNKGYADASIDAVAASARVSKKTLYARYANKAELFEAVVESRLAAWSAQATTRNKLAGRTLEQRLRNHLTTTVNWAASEEVRAFEQLMGTAPVATAHKLNNLLYGSIIDFLTSEIAEYTRAEGKPARNPRGVAFDLITFVAGWFHVKGSLGPTPTAEAIGFANHAVDLVFAARKSW